MRFKIDENLHDDVADLLAADGHDVETVHSEGLRGFDDTALEAHCRTENRALITLDLDFADLRAFAPANTSGIIVLRLHDQSRRHVVSVVSGILNLLKREPVAGRLWLVSEASVRVRS